MRFREIALNNGYVLSLGVVQRGDSLCFFDEGNAHLVCQREEISIEPEGIQTGDETLDPGPSTIGFNYTSPPHALLINLEPRRVSSSGLEETEDAVGFRTSTDQEALRVEDFPERVGRPLEKANRVRIRLLGEVEVRFQKGLEDWGTNPFRTRNGQ